MRTLSLVTFLTLILSCTNNNGWTDADKRELQDLCEKGEVMDMLFPSGGKSDYCSCYVDKICKGLTRSEIELITTQWRDSSKVDEMLAARLERTIETLFECSPEMNKKGLGN